MTTIRPRTVSMVYIAVFSVLLAVCAWITVPGPVPFTLQTLAVFLAPLLLGSKRAEAAVGVYILLGAAGVPVFAGFRAGPAVLLGPTGGYILGFLAIPPVYWLFTRLWGTAKWVRVTALSAGMLVCYTLGTVQFLLTAQSSGSPYTLGAALMTCVVPFIPADALKLAAAMWLSGRLKKHLPF